MYPWPIGDVSTRWTRPSTLRWTTLERTEQAEKFVEVQRVAAMAIVAAWKGGVRHRIKLAHVAIKAVERKAEPYLNPTLNQRRN